MMEALGLTTYGVALAGLFILGCVLWAVPAAGQPAPRPAGSQAQPEADPYQPGVSQAPPAATQAKPPVRPATHANVAYGPHPRNILNVWVVPSDKPTPLVFRIHGGGFLSGSATPMALMEEYLKRGISVASITYRFSNEAPYPAQMHDCARAVQLLRSKAAQWNLDPNRFGAMGGSAGGGISLWLGFHDDLADPTSPDPIARQSTRLTCMAVNNVQTSYDPRFIKANIPGPGWTAGPVWQLFGLPGPTDDIPPAIAKLMEEASPINYLTRDDPPVRMGFTWDDADDVQEETPSIHHPRFGRILKARMDALGIPCQFQYKLPSQETMADLDFFMQYLVNAPQTRPAATTRG